MLDVSVVYALCYITGAQNIKNKILEVTKNGWIFKS
jgi:hypothetical protein